MFWHYVFLVVLLCHKAPDNYLIFTLDIVKLKVLIVMLYSFFYSQTKPNGVDITDEGLYFGVLSEMILRM